MALYGLGKFGDGNKHVLFSHDLKTTITSSNPLWINTAFTGSGLAPITGPRGTMFQDANGDEAAYLFTSFADTAVGRQLDHEGHIKIRCDRQWLCRTANGPDGNSGDELATSQTLLSYIATVGGGTFVGFRKFNGPSASAVGSFGGAIDLEFRNFKQTGLSNALLHTGGKDEDVDVDICWKGSIMYLIIDGHITNAASDRAIGANERILNSFHLGSDKGTATRFPKDHWFSNLEVRAKFPEFALNYDNRNIAVLSDSLFDAAGVAGPNGDIAAYMRIQAKFMESGQYINMNIGEFGGYRVSDNGGAGSWLGEYTTTDPLGNIPMQKALETNPNKVLVSGGTNDGLADNKVPDATFQAAMIDIVEKLAGENGNPATNVQEVLWLIPIPLYGGSLDVDYDKQVTQSAAVRGIIKTLPQLWKDAYPSSQLKITLIDSFAFFGGEAQPVFDDIYAGQNTGTLTDLHLAPHGQRLWGEYIAKFL